VYWKSRHDQVIEIRGFLHQVKSRYKFTESQYMIFCILCGTDFFEKRLICNQFGVAKIFDALEAVKSEFDVWDKPCDYHHTQQSNKIELDSLLVFIRQLYTDKLSGTSKGVMAVVRNKNNAHVELGKRQPLSFERLTELFSEKGGKIKMPSMEAVQKAYDQIAFNYRYWRDRKKWPKGMFGTSPESSTTSEQPPAAASIGVPVQSVQQPTPMDIDVDSPPPAPQLKPMVQVVSRYFAQVELPAAASRVVQSECIEDPATKTVPPALKKSSIARRMRTEDQATIDDVMETDREWKVIPAAAASSHVQPPQSIESPTTDTLPPFRHKKPSSAAQLVDDLNEEANRFRNAPPPPHTQVTELTYTQRFSSIIRSAIGGRNRSGAKRNRNVDFTLAKQGSSVEKKHKPDTE
jgi:hypothetical protein